MHVLRRNNPLDTIPRFRISESRQGRRTVLNITSVKTQPLDRILDLFRPLRAASKGLPGILSGGE